MHTQIGGISVQCSTGNIASQQDIAAVVTPTGSQLEIGQGISATLHNKAGSGLYEESIALGPLQPGQAVVTGGYRLPNRYVIHCCVPFQTRGKYAPKQLADCYRNALRLASQLQLESIVFPPLVAGGVGTPPEDPAQIALAVIREMAPQLKGMHTIRFILFSRHAFVKFKQLLENQDEALGRDLA